MNLNHITIQSDLSSIPMITESDSYSRVGKMDTRLKIMNGP